MSSLHGPYSISSQMQVKLPAKLARQHRLQASDEFYWRTSDEDPSVLWLVPAEVVERRYALGDQLERRSADDGLSGGLRTAEKDDPA